MNERIHFLKKIYPSHFIRKGWCWLCVRGELETGTDCYILTQSSFDHSSTSLASCLTPVIFCPRFFPLFPGVSVTVSTHLIALTAVVGHWGLHALRLQADSHAGIWSPNDTNCNSNCMELTQAICRTWLYFCLRPPASCGRTHLH